MRIPALRRDSASALAKVAQGLEAAERRLAELGDRRLGLLESGDVAGARRVDQEIAAVFGDVAALKDRAVILEGKVEAEQQERDKEQYRQAVDKLEGGPVARRNEAARAVEKWFADGAVILERFAAADAATLAACAAIPHRSDRVYYPAYLGATRFGSRFGDVLGPDLIDRRTRRAPSSTEWFARLCKLCVRAGGLAAGEAEQTREMISNSRTAHDPIPVEDETEPENEEQVA
jgi:hypothetical protein